MECLGFCGPKVAVLIEEAIIRLKKKKKNQEITRLSVDTIFLELYKKTTLLIPW